MLEPLVEAVISATPNAVVIFSPNGSVVASNSKALELFGFDSLEDKNVEDLAQTCTQEDGTPISSATFVSEQANEPRKFMIRSKKTGKWILVYASPVGSQSVQLGKNNVGAITVYSEKTEIIKNLGKLSRDLLQKTKYELDAEDHLLEAIKIRDDFISMASHELKTPITSMKLQVEIVKRKHLGGQLTRPQLDKLFSTWEDQLDRLNSLIDGMLDVAALSEGQIKTQASKMDLGAAIRSQVDRFYTEQICFVEKKEVIGFWDVRKIDQIVSNLLTNAIKYGHQKPIEITLTQEGNQAIIEVTDHGEGIDPENFEKIFRRFERVQSGISVGGIGLGLYIVKQIVEKNGGSISVQSKKGEGSTFTVKIPLQYENHFVN
jgi:signal transduction histidine kinase